MTPTWAPWNDGTGESLFGPHGYFGGVMWPRDGRTFYGPHYVVFHGSQALPSIYTTRDEAKAALESLFDQEADDTLADPLTVEVLK